MIRITECTRVRRKRRLIVAVSDWLIVIVALFLNTLHFNGLTQTHIDSSIKNKAAAGLPRRLLL